MKKMKPKIKGLKDLKKVKVAVQDVGIGRRREIQAAAAGEFFLLLLLVTGP